MDELPRSDLTARDLLAHLDSDVADGRRREILDAFADAIQPLFDFIVASGGPSPDGERAFGLSHLAARSITDLVAAGHLASHAYLQQAYAVLRPVHENVDLMELFAQNADEAGKWINSTKPGAEYRPSDVRKRIASPSVDQNAYGHLSEMGSHPRFAGSHLSGGMRVNIADPSDRQFVLRMGSFLVEHPVTVTIWTFLFDGVIRVGFKLRHLSLVSARATREGWLTAYFESARHAARGCRLVYDELVEMGHGEGAEFLSTVYEDLLAAVAPGGDLWIDDDPDPRVTA